MVYSAIGSDRLAETNVLVEQVKYVLFPPTPFSPPVTVPIVME